MTDSVLSILKTAVERGASDLIVVAGLPVSCKINGAVERLGDSPLMPEDTQRLADEVYAEAGRTKEIYNAHGDDDFSLTIKGLSRFRVAVFRQRGSCSMVVRVVAFSLPDPTALGIPEGVMKFAAETKGLVLVTGPAGSGKSTTLACLIDRINSTRRAHIITIEDPIEFLHRHKVGIVSQREIASDTESYEAALRGALRQAPDVILLGEMRDLETIRAAMTAAETGHLVLSTLHTLGAASTVDRIVDIFPPAQQAQIRVQLSMVLRGVISQQLIAKADGHGAVPAFEIMHATNAVRNLIREAKTHQIDAVISTSAAEGMRSMDAELAALVRSGTITAEAAMTHALIPDQLKRRLGA